MLLIRAGRAYVAAANIAPSSSRDVLQLLVGELDAVLLDERQPFLGGFALLDLLDHLRRHVLQPHGTHLSLRRTASCAYVHLYAMEASTSQALSAPVATEPCEQPARSRTLVVACVGGTETDRLPV